MAIYLSLRLIATTVFPPADGGAMATALSGSCNSHAMQIFKSLDSWSPQFELEEQVMRKWKHSKRLRKRSTAAREA